MMSTAVEAQGATFVPVEMTLANYRGVARTKIAFTSDRDATKEHRAKELYIVDYDGFNPRRITVNNSLNILPAWSPDGRALSYISYRQGGPALFVARIYEGRSDVLTKPGEARPSQYGEPPNLLATCQPDRAIARLAPAGWRTLRGG